MTEYYKKLIIIIRIIRCRRAYYPVFSSMAKRTRDDDCLYVPTVTHYTDFEATRDYDNMDVEVLGVYWTREAAKEAEREAKIDFICEQVLERHIQG